MKSTKIIVSLIAASCFISSVNAQVANADSMIHKVFATLKAKDKKAFVALYPSSTQFPKIMRSMMNQMMKSEQMMQMMANDPSSKNLNIDSLIDAQVNQMSSPEALSKMEEKFSNNFKEAIEKGESKGVNWSNAEITSYTIDSSSSSITGDPTDDMVKGTGMKSMKGVIDFKSGDSAYQMSFNEIIYMPSENGWFGGDFRQVIRKGESFQEEETSMPDEVSVVDTVAVPYKGKTKSKSKSKTSSTKTKTKTKTPARKPATKS